jgi:hypothetical protein
MNKAVIIFFVLLAFSCKKGEEAGCFTPTGDIQKETRVLENFTKMTLYDNINVILVPGSENLAEVEAGENLIPGISTKIENGELIITNENRCNFTRSYKYKVNVRVTFNALKEITHYGAGKISNEDTIQQSYFRINQFSGAGDFDFTFDGDTLEAMLHTGAGNLYAKGKLNYGYLYSAANSIFKCENLIVQNLHINNKTTGNFYVHAVAELIVEVRSSSTVYYKGNPALTIFSFSNGEVKPF